jgi:hypothetical protein
MYKMWKLILKTDKHYYWKHSEGYYNCTLDNNPPSVESGYYSLAYLLMVKNDEIITVNGYNIVYNGFWHKWQMSHDNIGFIGQYINLEDAIRDAENG